MKTFTKLIKLAALVLVPTLAWGSMASLSGLDAASGLKGALEQGTQAAVAQLGAAGGFYNNAKLRIPLPESLQKAEKIMKLAGMGKQSDALVAKMNEAAEAAVPLAKPVLVQAIKSMSVDDAKQVLTGGEGSVTQFFKNKTQAQLKTELLPLVKKTTDQVGLASQYNSLAAKAAPMGLIKGDAANIETYVTGKTLDGLFAVIAEEEKKIRANPMAAASSLVQTVFGALRK